MTPSRNSYPLAARMGSRERASSVDLRRQRRASLCHVHVPGSIRPSFSLVIEPLVHIPHPAGEAHVVAV